MDLCGTVSNLIKMDLESIEFNKNVQGEVFCHGAAMTAPLAEPFVWRKRAVKGTPVLDTIVNLYKSVLVFQIQWAKDSCLLRDCHILHIRLSEARPATGSLYRFFVIFMILSALPRPVLAFQPVRHSIIPGLIIVSSKTGTLPASPQGDESTGFKTLKKY